MFRNQTELSHPMARETGPPCSKRPAEGELTMRTGRTGLTSGAVAARRVVLGFAWMAAAWTVLAQADRGSIEGTVTDPSGAAIPNAQVEVINIETNSKLDFSSNELGNYLAPNLPVASYRIVVRKDGFRTLVREPILVRSQGSSRVDFALQVGSLSDTVNITTEAPLLDVSATTAPSNLSE